MDSHFGVVLTPLKKIQILKNKAVRKIGNSFIFSSITARYHEFQILTISDLYFTEVAKRMHQRSSRFLRENLSYLFDEISSVHSCATKSQAQKNLYFTKFTTNRAQKSFKHQGVKV